MPSEVNDVHFWTSKIKLDGNVGVHVRYRVVSGHVIS